MGINKQTLIPKLLTILLNLDQLIILSIQKMVVSTIDFISKTSPTDIYSFYYVLWIKKLILSIKILPLSLRIVKNSQEVLWSRSSACKVE